MMDFDLKERVRSAVDIVDVIGSSLSLQPKGRLYVTQCPWHNDQSPSLQVNRERQSWKCWPCDIGGDVFSFVMRRDGVDFFTALKMLAEQAGIEIQAGKQVEAGSAQDKSTLLSAVQLVCDAYFQQLDSPKTDDAKIARDYLAARGVDDENRKRFQIGFAPDSWDFVINLLKQNKFRPEIAHAAGVAFHRKDGSSYDMFRGRLMFPIHDIQGRAISMGGRVIPEIAKRHGENAGGKYINGPETLLFRKSNVLYGMQLAREPIRKGGQALVMEGYTDVVAARQAGIEPVVAVLGTALGAAHVDILKRLTQRVVLVLDGDAAGQKRADEVLELFVQADADLRVLTLPDGSDPADYLQQHGREAFEQLVADAPDCLSHKLAKLTEGVDIATDTHAVMHAIDTMVGVIASAPKMDPVKQDQLLLRLSRTFGTTTEKLEQRVVARRAEIAKQSAARAKFRLQAARSKEQSGHKPKPQTRESADGSFDPNLMLAESADMDGFDFAPSGFAYDDEPTSHVAEVLQQSLSGIDRELFETLIESPDLAAIAVEAIDPDWLSSNTAKMLLSAYQDLDLQGRDLTSQSLLLLLENEFLKNEVTTLLFRIEQRGDKISLTAEERYLAVVARYRLRESEAETSRQIAKLATTVMDEDEELALLKQLFDSEKARQQIN
ncbi:DNA primase [Stieleria varia]|nr:DNA primase [Stieleria varia]